MLITIFIILPFLIGFFITKYFIRRINKVNSFLISVLNLVYDHSKQRILKGLDYKYSYSKFYNKLNYNKILYSFKPLKLETFYTEDEIKELLNI
jgi:hypothetical protein